jgi:hypothetical protein
VLVICQARPLARNVHFIFVPMQMQTEAAFAVKDKRGLEPLRYNDSRGGHPSLADKCDQSSLSRRLILDPFLCGGSSRLVRIQHGCRAIVNTETTFFRKVWMCGKVG